jgi:hypothetical protein
MQSGLSVFCERAEESYLQSNHRLLSNASYMTKSQRSTNCLCTIMRAESLLYGHIMWMPFLTRLPNPVILSSRPPYFCYLKTHVTAYTPFPRFSAKLHVKSGILNNSFATSSYASKPSIFYVVSLPHLLFTYFYSFRIRIICILHHYDSMTTLPHHST